MRNTAGPGRRKLDLGHGQVLVVASSEEMKELRDRTVDVTVTSPPYNLGKRYKAEGYGEYDDNKREGDYLEFLERVFKEVYRVTKDDGLFFLNLGEGARTWGLSEKVVERACRAGFRRLQTIIWVKSIFGKGHFTPSGRGKRLNHVWEFVFLFYKKKGYRIDPLALGVPYADKSNIGRYSEKDLRDPGDVWLVPYGFTTGHTIKKGHEAIFPIELAWRCIKLVPGAELALDPFAGTCSTLRAAKELGVNGLGYEPYPDTRVIKRRMGQDFKPLENIVLPDLEAGIGDLFRLLAIIQGLGHHPLVSKAFGMLPAGARKRLKRIAKEKGFEFMME